MNKPYGPTIVIVPSLPSDAIQDADSTDDPNGRASSLLDQLLADSKLYTRSRDYFELMEFVARLRNFAPFNAMLLHLQKPGLSHAASARDWKDRFGRTIKEGARPLLILWPFGPVALVYDFLDTEGKPLPEDVFAFPVGGDIEERLLSRCFQMCHREGIAIKMMDQGDNRAGSIRREVAKTDNEQSRYTMFVNRNHSTTTQFVTMAHELGHMFLGHLGQDKRLQIPDRPRLALFQKEFEAESVAYLVALRQGIQAKSHKYLSDYVGKDMSLDTFDLYAVFRAAGQVESLLKLGPPVTPVAQTISPAAKLEDANASDQAGPESVALSTQTPRKPVGGNPFAWFVFWVAVIVVPITFGWFNSNRIECVTCFREVLLHQLAFLGFIALSGFTYSLSRPSRNDLHYIEAYVAAKGRKPTTSEEVMLGSMLFGILVASMGFFSTYKF